MSGARATSRDRKLRQMGTEISPERKSDELPASSPEVEFALVLSRMIDSVGNDPEHLRQTIYELARYKLREQCAGGEDGEAPQLKALETAIQGVETFVRKNPAQLTGLRKQERPALVTARDFPIASVPQQLRANARSADTVIEADAAIGGVKFKNNRAWSKTVWRLCLVLATGLGVVLAVQRLGVFTPSRPKPDAPATIATSETPAATIARRYVPVDEPRRGSDQDALVPRSYGIYAVAAEKLYELQQLPGRAPDLRVAISPLIATPSRTTLPDGHLRFIVFRRDSAVSAAERAEVRIVARIERELNFDKSGKPVSSKAAEPGWVIRNIAIPFRTAPYKNEPDMYEIQNEDDSAVLPPGRYALVLKGQAYDFSVAGEIVDPRQCLERMAATNGQFYSQCEAK